MSVTYTEVYENLNQLSKSIHRDSYPYDFLACFGTAKASIIRLKKTYETCEEIISKGQIHFKNVQSDLEDTLNALIAQKSLKTNKVLFVIVTDYETVFAHDVKAKETIQIAIHELHDEFEFFLPLAGKERASLASESIADAKAAEKMAKLFDLLKIENAVETQEQIHEMNVFLSRVLFCFFAEDTGIFAKNQFTKTVGSLSSDDGSNLHKVMQQIFDVLNTTNRENCSNNFKSFPYVNGGLFSENISVPKFNVRSRRAFLECGSLDWSAINPDIFGSMIQAVMDVKKRSEMGIHYTSVQNIMKVLSPLFLDKLTDEFQSILDSSVKDETKVKNLKNLAERISKIKIGDMACGSGNFLIIAYKELRLLEMNIFKEIRKLEGNDHQMNLLLGAPQSGISLKQFYGIEYDDFACSIAILSLWLIEHQMNQQFNDEFGASEATLPLKSFNNIRHGNALRMDWNEVMPNEGEVYIVGNPPFIGARKKKPYHTDDLSLVSIGINKYKNLDYVSGWFIKSSDYIAGNKRAKYSLVATNSICQGEAVDILWSNLLTKHLIEIEFAFKSFNWSNNAKGKAGVTCVIVGVRNNSNEPKYLFEDDIKNKVQNINAYLIPAPNVFISPIKIPLHSHPKMIFGSMPNDNGNLILSNEEKNNLVSTYPEAQILIRKLIGSKELINSLERYCLWIKDEDLELANSIPPVKERISQVKSYRENSERAATKKLSKTPHKFGEIRHEEKKAIFFPSISSENRTYIPCDFFDSNVISTNKNFIINGGNEALFALLSAKHNMLWAKAVAGRTRNDICYSNTICYNTLPLPKLTEDENQILIDHAKKIIRQRILETGSLASMYGTNKMPDGLRQAHQELDEFVDSLYQKAAKRSQPINTDAERLEVLFKLYAEMKEKQNGN